MSNRPNRPQLPAHLRRLDQHFAGANRALNVHDGEAMLAHANELLAYLVRQRTPEELAAEARYERERLIWNAWVEEQRAAARGRQHDREVAKVRQAACPRCTSTHPGEC
jgi:hypothetical protein